MDFNLIETENLLLNLVFAILFFVTLFSLFDLIFFPESKSYIISYINNLCILIATGILFFVIGSRWVTAGYFPLTNLYESLLFLTWLLLVIYLYVACTWWKGNKLITTIVIPIALLVNGFATLALPPEMQNSSPLIPALQSNWLTMHVTTMLLSYGTLIVGSAISIFFLVVYNDKAEKELKEIEKKIDICKNNMQSEQSKREIAIKKIIKETVDYFILKLKTRSKSKSGKLDEPVYRIFFGDALKDTLEEPKFKSILGRLDEEIFEYLIEEDFKLLFKEVAEERPFNNKEQKNNFRKDVARFEEPIKAKLKFIFEEMKYDEITSFKSQQEHLVSKVKFYENIANCSYRIITFGFCCLTIGIISGSVWANEAWGSYWSWDPKETWSLITWTIFAIYLHVYINDNFSKKTAAYVACVGFFSIWICYLGVNFLGKGLHSYGWL